MGLNMSFYLSWLFGGKTEATFYEVTNGFAPSILGLYIQMSYEGQKIAENHPKSYI